jgi:hypothetical protein
MWAQLITFLDDAHDSAGQVDRIGFHHAGMHCSFTAKKSTSGFPTSAGNRFHDRSVPLWLE